MTRHRDPLSVEPRTIYLQLHNYAFFHGPSQVDDVDDRFIGRDHILTKLRTLLTNAESKSGAYLVTGYRGMGKSSFVGRVLNDITSFQTSGRKTSRYFRILVPLLFFSLLDVLRAPALLFAAPFLVFSTTTIYLLQSSPHIPELAASFQLHRGGLGELWLRLRLARNVSGPIFWDLWRIDSPVSSRRPRMFAQDFFLLSVIQVVATLYFFFREWIERPATGSGRLTVYLVLFALLVIFNLVGRAKHSRQGVRLGWWYRLKKLAADFAAHSDQVHIRINLGYDDLSELDILRLMSRNVLSSYRAKMRAFSFPQISWTTAKALILYVMVGLFFYAAGLYQLHQDLSLSTRRAVGEILGESRLAAVVEPTRRVAHSVDRIVQRTYDLTKNAAPALFWPFSEIRDVIFLTPLNSVLVPKLSGDYRSAGTDSREQFRLLPKDINYLFWLYFTVAWVSTGWLSRRGFGGLVTHSLILKRLQELNDLIDSQVTQESGGPSNAPGWLSFLRRSKRTYQRLSDREIEKQLIEILDDVARIPRISMRPEFILIFDEVDKIEPHQNATYAVQAEAGVSTSALGSADILRSRQRNIQRLLSNLKYLLTTAKAKFIFIAGRELFDASLADVSDRNFFMGSIFNEVINVESFMKDRLMDPDAHEPSPHHGDVTRMAEYFVFSALLPPEHRAAGCTALCYRSYIANAYGSTPSRTDALSSTDIDTVMGVLHNFVTYLTYRSNGAPKKLASLFERYVTQCNAARLSSHRALCVGHTSKQLYLCFDATDRYTFSVGAYVITPFFTSLDKQIKEFGDKLLVSSAFLVDHLYKFHRAAFSWRSIELTPEILDINRAPHLRELITTIVRFLQRGHLKEVDNGLFNFKFRRKISEEISVLSRLNEREAAAFNFTLDESLATKQHYTKQLRDLEHRYKPHYGATPVPEWVRSISFLHMIIGDLHYYDEEYDNAIVEYMEAVQLFGRDRVKSLPFESFIVLVRNTLKLGLSFERRRTYDSALMTYGKLVARIIRFREVRRGEIHDPTTDVHDDDAVMAYVDQEPLTRNRAYLAFRQDVMQSMRLLYQPALAKFQIKEKLFKDGVTPRDLRTVDREWKAIVGVAPTLIQVDFLDRTGDVLFYKNRSWIPAGDPPLALTASPIRPIYCHDRRARCGQNDELDKVMAQGRDTPCVACRRYNSALDLLTDGPLLPGELKDGDRVSRVTALADLLDREAGSVSPRKTAAVLRALAANLSNIADAFLSCAGPVHRVSPAFLELLAQWLHGGDEPARRTRVAAHLRGYLARRRVRPASAPLGVRNTSAFNKTEEVFLYVLNRTGNLGGRVN